MMYLIQLYRMTNCCPYFIGLLSDIKGQAEDCGYDGCEDELVGSILFDEFGIEGMDRKQLKMLTECLMRNPDLNFLEAFKV